MTVKKLIKVERTVRLAELLTEDIQERHLGAGDPYMTTLEAAAFLGVSGASANRALQLLERRKVIARSQKKGAYILDPIRKKPLLEQIHFLFERQFYVISSFGEHVIEGVREELPLSKIRYLSLTPKTEYEDVKELLENIQRSGIKCGFAMVSVSPQIQQLVGESGYPCVILGTRCPGVPKFHQIDIDHSAALRLLVDYLRLHQCERIGLVVRRSVLPGDIGTINTALQLGIDRIHFIQQVADEELLAHEMEELLESESVLDGYVCLDIFIAEALQKTLLSTVRDRKRKEVEITAMYNFRTEGPCEFPHVIPLLDVRMYGRRTGRLLHDAALGLSPKNEIIPVKLEVYDS